MAPALIGAATPALACDCGHPLDRKITVQMIRTNAKAIVAGEVTSVRIVGPKSGDPLVVADVAVTRTIKGNAPEKITIESYGGDNGGNCGIGTSLLRNGKGAAIVLVLDKPSASGRHHIKYCNQLSPTEVSGRPSHGRMRFGAISQQDTTGSPPCHASPM
jgi:hypothetical protein